MQSHCSKDGKNEIQRYLFLFVANFLNYLRLCFSDGANNVTNVRVLNNSLDMVTITWDEPSDPNGIILTYLIQYRIISSVDVSDFIMELI